MGEPIDVTPKPEFPVMYLGDAVYATFDGYHIWLRTSNGVSFTNEVALEPSVLDALDVYRQRLKEHFSATTETG